jgi:hypothetical protein
MSGNHAMTADSVIPEMDMNNWHIDKEASTGVCPKGMQRGKPPESNAILGQSVIVQVMRDITNHA